MDIPRLRATDKEIFEVVTLYFVHHNIEFLIHKGKWTTNIVGNTLKMHFRFDDSGKKNPKLEVLIQDKVEGKKNFMYFDFAESSPYSIIKDILGFLVQRIVDLKLNTSRSFDPNWKRLLNKLLELTLEV